MFHGLWGVATNGKAREARQLLISRLAGSWDTFLTTFLPSFEIWRKEMQKASRPTPRRMRSEMDSRSASWEKRWGGLPDRCPIRAAVAWAASGRSIGPSLQFFRKY